MHTRGPVSRRLKASIAEARTQALLPHGPGVELSKARTTESFSEQYKCNIPCFDALIVKRYILVPEHFVPGTSALSIYFFWMIGHRHKVMRSNQSILWLWFGLRILRDFIDLSRTGRYR